MSAKQQEIIAALKVKPTIDVQEEIRISIDFMKEYLKKHPFLNKYGLRYFWRTRFYISWETCTTCSR